MRRPLQLFRQPLPIGTELARYLPPDHINLAPLWFPCCSPLPHPVCTVVREIFSNCILLPLQKIPGCTWLLLKQPPFLPVPQCLLFISAGVLCLSRSHNQLLNPQLRHCHPPFDYLSFPYHTVFHFWEHSAIQRHPVQFWAQPLPLLSSSTVDFSVGVHLYKR